MSKAVLICNGLSARGYNPPDDVYSMTLNGGFLRHRADGALTVDCPGVIRDAWRDFGGDRVVAAHMPEFPQGERFECLELVRRFSSTTPVALAWLAARKGITDVTIVGLDSLWGGGAPGAAYNKHVMDMLVEMSQYFPEGFNIQRGKETASIGSPDFAKTIARWRTTALPPVPANAARPKPPEARPKPTNHLEAVSQAIPVPKITQRLVEFDLCTACTRNCEFCAPGIPKARRRKRTNLSKRQHDRIIDQLAKAGYGAPGRYVVYAGHGEPLLHPRFPELVKYAKDQLPHAEVFCYTNGDRLDRKMFSELAAAGIDAIIYDCYDDETGRKVYRAMMDSTIDPARVLCMDHVGVPRKYSSRCGTVKDAEPLKAPCTRPTNALFLSAAGRWRICCEDYSWTTDFGKLSPLDLNALPEYATLRDALKAGDRSASPCNKCERKFSEQVDYKGHPRLDSIKRLRSAPVPPTLKAGFRRLVIVPCTLSSCKRPQADAASVVLDAIDRRSTVTGSTLILWNDDKEKHCPAALRGHPDKRIIWEYESALGWSGINRGIGEAFNYALREGYDAVIKIDSADVAIMRDGWDAFVLSDLPDFAMSGHVVPTPGAHYGGDIANHPGPHFKEFSAMPWSRSAMARKLNVDHYCQGGCYLFGRSALEYIAKHIGMPDKTEASIGEDRAFTMRAQVLQIPIVQNRYVQSHFCRQWDYSLSSARHFRDDYGKVVLHPVRNLGTLTALCHEG